jgi:hypothetical protein
VADLVMAIAAAEQDLVGIVDLVAGQDLEGVDNLVAELDLVGMEDMVMATAVWEVAVQDLVGVDNLVAAQDLVVMGEVPEPDFVNLEDMASVEREMAPPDLVMAATEQDLVLVEDLPRTEDMVTAEDLGIATAAEGTAEQDLERVEGLVMAIASAGQDLVGADNLAAAEDLVSADGLVMNMVLGTVG